VCEQVKITWSQVQTSGLQSEGKNSSSENQEVAHVCLAGECAPALSCSTTTLRTLQCCSSLTCARAMRKRSLLFWWPSYTALHHRRSYFSYSLIIWYLIIGSSPATPETSQDAVYAVSMCPSCYAIKTHVSSVTCNPVSAVNIL
jgi:hypothetical protein